jgi:hypothetical protein
LYCSSVASAYGIDSAVKNSANNVLSDRNVIDFSRDKAAIDYS